MTDLFIWAAGDPAKVKTVQSEQPSIRLQLQDKDATTLPKVGDRILLAEGRNGELDHIQPRVFSITETKSNHLAATVVVDYSNPVPISTIRSVLNRPLSLGPNRVQTAEFQAIIDTMGAIRVSEKQLLDHIKKHIAARGYYFDNETIYNYHICLKTRPFVILAGLSGTGKSKLSQLYAEAIGHTVQNDRYLRLAVRPSWNDDRYLLGYLNTITGEYISEPALDFITRAEQDRENLYFFCLDEMNLAHVEYYFSQFLSAMEEENVADRRIHLYSESTQRRLAGMNDQQPDRVVLLPHNLLFTGTINVDETTQPISDKVIDRANTLEFFSVELDKVPDRQPPPDVIQISAHQWHSYVVKELDTSYRQQVIEIGKILNQVGLGLGYRVLREIELYMANSKGLLEPDAAFDLQVKQRILPRVRGPVSIAKSLKELHQYAGAHNLPRTADRLSEMIDRLTRDGYTSFWR